MIFLLLSALGQSRSPAESLPFNCKEDPSIPFSYYGYQHCKLFREGAIDQPISRTGQNCCDGGYGGECRATMVTRKNGQWYAQIDGLLCPLNKTPLVLDISLPNGIFAMVCAPKPNANQLNPLTGVRIQCPAIYCAAAVPAT